MDNCKENQRNYTQPKHPQKYYTQLKSYAADIKDIKMLISDKDGHGFFPLRVKFFKCWLAYIERVGIRDKAALIDELLGSSKIPTANTLNECITFMTGGVFNRDHISDMGMYECLVFLGRKLQRDDKSFLIEAVPSGSGEFWVARDERHSIIEDAYSWMQKVIDEMNNSQYYNFAPDSTGKDYYIEAVNKIGSLIKQEAISISHNNLTALLGLLDDIKYMINTYDFPNVPESWMEEFPDSSVKFFDAAYEVIGIADVDPALLSFIPTAEDITNQNNYFENKSLIDRDELYKDEVSKLFDRVFRSRIDITG